MPKHNHPEYEHGHEHGHDEFDHEHSTVPKHDHDDRHPMLKHDHGDLRGLSRGLVRAVLTVIEWGPVNSEQLKAIHAVRVILGDAYGSACPHENVAYEEGDVLICQDCRAIVTP